uniref:Uncharacterized protein n=1 Tax=Nelumbo nucifera TaxID=4432 RepID=A0A822ZTM1_NELNU|nr:TPA_asm: hypothetical protein HUJ06_003448 [Nelumbo nucifera]
MVFMDLTAELIGATIELGSIYQTTSPMGWSSGRTQPQAEHCC